MKNQRLILVLTAMNIAILAFNLATPRRVRAREDVAPVLRGRSLEIVDEHGKVRAQLAVLQPNPAKDGEKAVETVLLRLIDPNGRPGVKLGTSVDGSGMSLDGRRIEQREWSGVQLLAKPDGIAVKLTGSDGRVKEFQP